MPFYPTPDRDDEWTTAKTGLLNRDNGNAPSDRSCAH